MTGEWDFHASGDGFSEHDFAGAAELHGDGDLDAGHDYASGHDLLAGSDLGNGQEFGVGDFDGADAGHDTVDAGHDDVQPGHDGAGPGHDGVDYAGSDELAGPHFGTDHDVASFTNDGYGDGHEAASGDSGLSDSYGGYDGGSHDGGYDGSSHDGGYDGSHDGSHDGQDAYDLGGHGYFGEHEYVDDHALVAGHDVVGGHDAVSGHDFGSFDHFTDAGIHGGGYDLAGADPHEDGLWSQLMVDMHDDVNPFAAR